MIDHISAFLYTLYAAIFQMLCPQAVKKKVVDVADGNIAINSLCQKQIVLITYRKFTLLSPAVSVLSHHCSHNNNPIVKVT